MYPSEEKKGLLLAEPVIIAGTVLPEIIICFISLTIIHGNPDLDTVNRAL